MSRSARVFDDVQYAPGARFRVIREGCYLHGMKPYRDFTNTWDDFKQDLQIGDTLTCDGYGPGWGSDPGYGVEWTTEESRRVTAIHCEFRPMAGSIWNYRPAIGYLERIT